MNEFVSQVGAFIGTSVILFIATKPNKQEETGSPRSKTRVQINLKGAKKYSRSGRLQTSFGMHDDFDM
jgi:hypothetical protein